ncbi:MAG: hypothetical protein ABSG33_10555 [Candidatus Bathyarchaeia archaeon]
MGIIGKSFTLILIFIMLVSSLSLTVVRTVCAQTGVTTPSAPDFGVKYQIFSVNIPPVYGVDPSTGKAVITKAGYTVVDEEVWVNIMNQPFVPYNESSGNSIQLFYNIRWKEPSNNSWIILPNYFRLTQSDSEYTAIPFDFKGNYQAGLNAIDIPIGSETDFQVEAAIGYYTADNGFVGKTSGWTNPQSIQHAGNYTIPSPSSSPSSTAANPSNSPSINPTETSQQSGAFLGLDWEKIAIIVLSTAVIVLGVTLVLSHRKSKQFHSSSSENKKPLV